MKRFVFAVVLALMAATLTQAQDEVYNFADNTLSFYKIEQQWHNQNLYTGSDSEKPAIDDYFWGLAQAYPNEFLNMVVTRMLGKEAIGIGDYVLDIHNGYISARLMAELELRVQMCYRHCTNGNILVGVALSGDEYDPVVTDDEDRMVLNVNDLMFFEIKKGEAVWWPRTPKVMTGRDFNFHDFNVELPRVGKDITLSPGYDNPKAGNYLLKWNGAKFTVVRK